jgi:hypothetical protein
MKIAAGMVLIVAALGGAAAGVARAEFKGRVTRELAEWAIRRSSGLATRGGEDALARRFEALAARHGGEVATAIHRVGPGAIPLMEGAGAQGGLAARLLARYRERAAWVSADPRRLALVACHGDAAARALIRHRSVAEPVVAALGSPAARALGAVGPQNARRLAMMAETGELARIGRADELLGVVGRFGDPAMEFIWRHKGALAVGTVLAAFLADPGQFLGGARDSAGVLVAMASRPVADLPGRLAAEATRRVDWTLLMANALGLVAAGFTLRAWLHRRRGPAAPH